MGEVDVLCHGQRGDEAELLEDHGDARTPRVQGTGQQEGSVAELQGPLIGLVDAVDHLDEGRLARAILAHEAVDLAAAQREVHAVKGLDAAEGLADARGAQDDVGCAAGRGSEAGDGHVRRAPHGGSARPPR